MLYRVAQVVVNPTIIRSRSYKMSNRQETIKRKIQDLYKHQHRFSCYLTTELSINIDGLNN